MEMKFVIRGVVKMSPVSLVEAMETSTESLASLLLANHLKPSVLQKGLEISVDSAYDESLHVVKCEQL